jgi:hypothetical protein
MDKIMTNFQEMLLKDLVPGVWYDCFWNQGSGGEILPDWFYKIQSNAWATLRPMIQSGHLEVRRVGDLRLPQVRRFPSAVRSS